MKYFLLLVLFSGCFGSYGQDMSEFLKMEYRPAEGKVLPYRILYPRDYKKAKKYPLVLVLHGAGERGNDNEKQLTHGARLFLDSAVRKNYPAIVVFPQCAQDQYWSSVQVDRTTSPIKLDFNYTNPITEPLAMTMELVARLKQEESIDDSRVYITGLSMGGMGTFEAVHRFPDTFAAAQPICGGGDTLRYQKVKTPFWVFHGEADGVVHVSHSRAMVRKLKAEKVDVRYTEYPGVNHNSWDNAFADPGFLPWMFRKKLKSAGK